MKMIDKFLGKDKEPDPSDPKSRAEAMTLEEMAVKVQERKILGPEGRKVDMNIIMFVSLCICGLVIINVVLYFLIGESRTNTLQPVADTQDARDLLKELREERVAHSSEQGLNSARKLGNDLSAGNGIAIAEETSIESSSANNTAADQQRQAQIAETPVLQDTAVQDRAVQGQVVQGQVVQGTEPGQIEILDNNGQQPLVDDSEPVEQILEPAPSVEEQEEIPFDLVVSVGRTINDWINAWSAQDADAYMAYYADTFVSEAGMNIEEWRAHREVRLTKPEWISVGVDKLKINAVDGGARAEFIQEYNASNYSDKELKKMIFKKVNGEWKIFDERATPVN